jgi:cytochrome c-type biogenesis protein
VPLLAIAYGSRGVLGARAAALARAARPVTAAVLILVGALTVSGGDRVIETRLVDVMPGWMIDLGSLF